MKEYQLPEDRSPDVARLRGDGRRSQQMVPYLVVLGSWWVLAMVVLTVRVALPTWRPVVELFWWQALLVEKMLPAAPAWVARGLWLLVYLTIGVALWFLMERRRPRGQQHRWRRALLASLAVQGVLVSLAMVIAPE